jgi:hypothetical protein
MRMRNLTLEARRDGWVGRVVTVATTIRKIREREKQYSPNIREREKQYSRNVREREKHNIHSRQC